MHVIRTQSIQVLLLLLLIAAMTYNQVHYFWVNHLADFTQNGHTNPCRIAIHRSTSYMYGMSCTDSSRRLTDLSQHSKTIQYYNYAQYHSIVQCRL